MIAPCDASTRNPRGPCWQCNPSPAGYTDSEVIDTFPSTCGDIVCIPAKGSIPRTCGIPGICNALATPLWVWPIVDAGRTVSRFPRDVCEVTSAYRHIDIVKVHRHIDIVKLHRHIEISTFASIQPELQHYSPGWRIRGRHCR